MKGGHFYMEIVYEILPKLLMKMNWWKEGIFVWNLWMKNKIIQKSLDKKFYRFI